MKEYVKHIVEVHYRQIIHIKNSLLTHSVAFYCRFAPIILSPASGLIGTESTERLYVIKPMSLTLAFVLLKKEYKCKTYLDTKSIEVSLPHC